MKKILIIFFILPFNVISQSFYSPQNLYDDPGGIFDEDSLRTIGLQFYDTNYHSYLVNSWYELTKFI